LTEASGEYRAATGRLHDVKAAIGRAHQLVQTRYDAGLRGFASCCLFADSKYCSKERLALDDPARRALEQEVARIFQEEGGVLNYA
jgi:hypothetical protein